MSPFQYEYAKLDANVCDGGTNVEQRMTCRSRSFHFRAATALHTSERSVKRLRGRVAVLTMGDVSPFSAWEAGGQLFGADSAGVQFGWTSTVRFDQQAREPLPADVVGEAAQGAVRCHPGFRSEYLHRCHTKAKGVAKVAARKLAIRLYWMLRTNTGPSSSTFSQAGRRSGTANLT